MNQIKFAIDANQLFSNVSTGCDKPVCTRNTLRRQHYVTTSKKYLTKSHILSKYFELIFLQLHLVKILRKLIIIWLNYERKKRCFLWNTVYIVLAAVGLTLFQRYDKYGRIKIIDPQTSISDAPVSQIKLPRKNII